jgi:membrane protease YdiL (CAAX protease family)
MVVPDNKRLQYLSWLTLFGMSAIGIVLINYWQNRDAQTVLLSGKNYYLQGLAGLFFGSLSALFAVMLIQVKRFKGTRTFFQNLIGNINPSFIHILFYSFCAGVGEEVLFRAGIQPIIGIWPTALLFVFLHGYINPTNLNLTIYGVFLIVICAGFGYLFKFFGLASAIIAHFIYDVAMFSILKYSDRKEHTIQTT